MTEITLSVCQGIGDIFWVYQKFVPHYDKVHFNILVVEKDEGGIDPKIQNRAIPFIESWPKVGDVGLALSNKSTYCRLAQASFNMKEIVESGESDVFYACNRPLEKGIRIEDIDPDFPIQETVELPLEKIDVPNEYICVYVSGISFSPFMHFTGGTWSVHDWVRFVNQFYDKYNLDLPIVMIGASYDKEVQDAILPRLKQKIVRINDIKPACVHYILKNAEYFLAHQSGLSILADNLDARQVMLYFPKLANLRFSWPKKRNIESGVYNAFTFSDSSEEVISILKS